jgi:guanosine-3',5'-bis(diphosphate) 3'-pyrophosphohydrolase
MMEDLKVDFFNERIFAFTPVGDVVDLPINSSVIDFAYAIHSDIGNHTLLGRW